MGTPQLAIYGPEYVCSSRHSKAAERDYWGSLYFDEKPKARILLPADGPILFVLHWDLIVLGGRQWCDTGVAFIPERGSEYAVMYLAPVGDGNVCAIDIREVMQSENGDPEFEQVATFPLDGSRPRGGLSKGLCQPRD